jgi:hypothetical protein
MARNECQVLACRRGIVIFPHGNRRRYLGTVTVIGALRTNTGLTELRLTPAPVALRAR